MRIEGPSNPPQVRLLRDGTLWLAAQEVRWIDASGKALETVPARLGRDRAASPVDGFIARTTNRGNWSTGREPWKSPGVRICRPDGSDLYQLYEWDGKYVGLDNHRSVADTHVMNLNYDDDGNLLLATWSDGGNTVMRL
jgi:YD repeat-containing protein